MLLEIWVSGPCVYLLTQSNKVSFSFLSDMLIPFKESLVLSALLLRNLLLLWHIRTLLSKGLRYYFLWHLVADKVHRRNRLMFWPSSYWLLLYYGWLVLRLIRRLLRSLRKVVLSPPVTSGALWLVTIPVRSSLRLRHIIGVIYTTCFKLLRSIILLLFDIATSSYRLFPNVLGLFEEVIVSIHGIIVLLIYAFL